MNKYYVVIPYSFTRRGELTCYIYAEDEESVYDLAEEYGNRFSEDYDDNDDEDGPSEYEYSNMRVSLDEENVDPPYSGTHHLNGFELNLPASLPEYFLAEINSL